MSDGKFLKNLTRNVIVYSSPDKQFAMTIRPSGEIGDTQYVPGKYLDEPGIRRIILRKICKIVDGETAIADEMKAHEEVVRAKEEKRAEVLSVVESEQEEELMRIQCSAKTTDGRRCSRKITVKAKEYEEGKEYFCKQHSAA